MNPWIWLSEPQHSSAVQALAAVLFGVPTILFLMAGTYAAYRQARAADRQAKAADTQAELSRTQLNEQVRPVLHITSCLQPELGWNAAGQIFFVENIGAGPALEVDYQFFGGSGLNGKEDLGWHENGDKLAIPPNHKDLLPARCGEFTTVRIYYQDLRGHVFLSAIILSGQLPPQLLYSQVKFRPTRKKQFRVKAA